MEIKKENIEFYHPCTCGAITVGIRGEGEYSVARKNFKKFFPNLDLRTLKAVRLPEMFCCNHCCNHYGLDLCGCGSGEEFNRCDNGFDECKIPMQAIGEYTSVRAADAIG